MDKSLEETRKMNAQSRQKNMESGSSYTSMSDSDLRQAREANMNSTMDQSNSTNQDSYDLKQARQENMQSGSSALNSVFPSSDYDSNLEKVKKENEKSRQNKGK